MNMTLVRNTLVLVALVTISTGYFAMLGYQVPPKFAIAINVVLVPILIGAIGYFALKASVGWKALMLLAVPLVNRLCTGVQK